MLSEGVSLEQSNDNSSDIPEASETSEKEKPGRLLGIDSEGREIYPDDTVLTLYKGLHLRVGRINPGDIDFLLTEDTSGEVLQEETIEQQLEHYNFKLWGPREWLQLTGIHSNKLRRAKKFAERHQKYEGKGELPNDLPTIGNFVLTNVERFDDAVTFVCARPYSTDVQKYTYSLDELVRAPFPYNQSIITEKEGELYLAPYQVSVRDKRTAIKPIFQRIESPEQVIELLVDEFPWFDREDIGNSSIEQGLFSTAHTSEMGHLSIIDFYRLRAAYDPIRNRILAHMLNKGESLTDAENSYLSARNYARLIEFAVALDNPKTYIENKEQYYERISNMTPEEKLEIVLDILAKVEAKTVELLRPRWERETQLFGKPIETPHQQYIYRFASRETLGEYRDALGLYNSGTLAFGDINLLFRTSDGNAQKSEDIYRHLIECAATVTSHEIGHSGLEGIRKTSVASKEGTNETWAYEEVWCQWKSVVYPYSIIQEKVSGHSPGAMVKLPFESAYENGVEREHEGFISLGGTRTLAGMITEISRATDVILIIEGKSYPISKDFVEKCALATAFGRQDRGTFTFMDQEVVGFGDLYDAYQRYLKKKFGRGYDMHLYEEKLGGSTDNDYMSVPFRNIQNENTQDSDEEKPDPIKIKAEKIIYEKLAEQASNM